jgi:hypothetical protein
MSLRLRQEVQAMPRETGLAAWRIQGIVARLEGIQDGVRFGRGEQRRLFDEEEGKHGSISLRRSR